MIETHSTITCPECGVSKKEEMPTDSCQYFYECTKCHTVLKPKHGDCCVFCSYGDTPCPPKQKEGGCVSDKVTKPAYADAKPRLRKGKPRKWGVGVLFASTATLLCCALPILLVSLGMGAVAASLYGEYFPWLQWFGRNEHITFGGTALILIIAGWAIYRPDRTCPADPELAAACNTAYKWNVRFYWGAVAIWCIGAFSAFVLPLLQ